MGFTEVTGSKPCPHLGEMRLKKSDWLANAYDRNLLSVCVCLPLPSPKQGEWYGQNGISEGKGELVATKSGRMMRQGGLIVEGSVSLLVK